MTESAWTQEPPLVSEAQFTTWGEGWDSWNEYSPELQFVEFVGALVALIQPKVVVESGVGQGFTTRRILAHLPRGGEVIAFESDPEIRERIPVDIYPLLVSHQPSISDDAMARADMVVLDSEPHTRRFELERFAHNAKRGSVLVVHDVGEKGAGPVQALLLAQINRWISKGLIAGTTLPNARGCFVGTKQ